VNDRIPEFVVRNDANDVSTQIRVQRIGNGFVVKTGLDPIFYSTIQEAAQAIAQGLVETDWEYIDVTATRTPQPRKSR